MALIVEDGTGKSDAESYLSVADCDTYWTKHGDPTTWSGATTAAKEEALRMATQYLDVVYGARFRGYRVDEDQSLAWPRSGIIDRDGYEVPDDALPSKLEEATAEAAHRHITETDGLIPDLDNPGTVGELEQQIGPLRERIKYTGGNSPIKRFRIIQMLLVSGSLIRPGMQIERS